MHQYKSGPKDGTDSRSRAPEESSLARQLVGEGV